MIHRQDVLDAIAECQGTRSPNANTAIKLAAFYIILDHLDDKTEVDSRPTVEEPTNRYSYDAPPIGVVQFDGDSEFAKVINGKSQSEVWAVIDELMSTIQVMNERLYNGVLRKLR